MNDVDTQKLALKERVKKVLEYLSENNIIHQEDSKPGLDPAWCFYSEDEAEVADLIKNQSIDNNTSAEELKEIFFKYAGDPKPRESFISGKFSVGASILGKNFLSNNADVTVEFVMESDYDSAEQYSFANLPKNMAFFMANVYPYAALIKGLPTTSDVLRERILAQTDTNEYKLNPLYRGGEAN